MDYKDGIKVNKTSGSGVSKMVFSSPFGSEMKRGFEKSKEGISNIQPAGQSGTGRDIVKDIISGGGSGNSSGVVQRGQAEAIRVSPWAPRRGLSPEEEAKWARESANLPQYFRSTDREPSSKIGDGKLDRI